MNTMIRNIYIPFLVTSGPLVYFLAHMVQHQSEGFFTPEQVMISWNLVPGTICLVLGGLQWFLIEWLWIRIKRWTNKTNRMGTGKQCEGMPAA